MAKGTIIYMGNFELPDKNASAHRVMNNGKIFKDLGYRVAYLGVSRDEVFAGIKQSKYCPDIYEEAYPCGMKQWVNHIFDTKNILAVAEKYDDTCLIIVYNVPYATFKAVKNVFKKKNIKVAYDCTEWNSFAEGSLPKRLYKKFDEKQVRNKLSKHCDDIIVISRLMEEKYKGANLLRLPPLVDTDEKIWHQEKNKTNENIFEFCFAAGSISNKEKPDVLISQFLKTKDENLRLRIIGIDKQAYTDIFTEHKVLLENESRISFMGMLSHEETVKYILGCDCYIFFRESTRRNEAGFPTKFAEAFTCGVPVISTNVSDIKEFADDRIILLDHISDENVSKAINDIRSKKSKENQLRDSFDYRKYLPQSRKWLDGVFR